MKMLSNFWKLKPMLVYIVVSLFSTSVNCNAIGNLQGENRTVENVGNTTADVITVINNNKTDLFDAISKNASFETVKALVSNGANINATNQDGNTPLLLAATNRQFKIVKYLLNKTANVNVVNKDGDSVIHIAIKKNAPLKIVKLLVQHGVNLKVKNHDERTPLKLANLLGKFDIVNYLEKHSPAEKHSQVPLPTLPIKNETLTLSKVLADRGGDIHKLDSSVLPFDALPNKNSSNEPKLVFDSANQNGTQSGNQSNIPFIFKDYYLGQSLGVHEDSSNIKFDGKGNIIKIGDSISPTNNGFGNVKPPSKVSLPTPVQTHVPVRIGNH